MVFFNWATMQMAAKIVYYGPGLCGKTSNLTYIYSKTSPKSRGEMVSLETESDRTLFFDLLPIEVGTIGGFKTRLQLYTVPGQVFYNTTRKLVLKGVDGLVFVADSQRPMRDANVESLKSLIENIGELGLSLDDLPLVIQFNKRDLENILTVDELLSDLNPDEIHPWYAASAVTGEGVFETLKEITKVTLKRLRARMASPEEEKPKKTPTTAAPPASQPPVPEPSTTPPAEPLPVQAEQRSISASALARAAEEGAGEDFPIPAPLETGRPEASFEADLPEAEAPELPDPDADVFEDLPPVEELEEALEIELDASPDGFSPPADEDAEPSPDEVTSPSIDEPEIEPFGLSAEAAPEGLDGEPAVEELQLDDEQPIETVETADEEVIEFDTDGEGPSEVAAPPAVKRVHVSSDTDILSQLDGLRRQATEQSSARGKTARGGREASLDINSLLGDTSGPKSRDLKRRIEHNLNSNLFERMHAMQIAFRIQDEDGSTIHTLDPVSVDVKDSSDLARLILQLTIDLQNLR